MVSRNLRDDIRFNLLLYATSKRQRQPIKKVKFMKKITAIYTDFEQKRKAGAEVSREQMRAERQGLNKQVNAVLTDTQKAKYEEMKKARRGGGNRDI